MNHMPYRPESDFAVLVEWLWSGEISEQRFVTGSLELGISRGQIEEVVRNVKQADGVA